MAEPGFSSTFREAGAIVPRVAFGLFRLGNDVMPKRWRFSLTSDFVANYTSGSRKDLQERSFSNVPPRASLSASRNFFVAP
jgi:hypothetical protein